MMKKVDFKQGVRIVIGALPLAGIIAGSLLPLSNFGHQLMILALLVWLQFFLLFEVFLAKP
jgi:hypothetical protein